METGDGGSPTGGDIKIDKDGDPDPERVNVLYVKGKDGRSIRRPVDLGACATGTPTLSFDWRRKDDLTGGKEVYLEYSTNGTTWSAPQATFSGEKEDVYRTYSQVIPAAYRVAGAQLRFRSSDDNDKLLYIDNVRIEGLCDVIAPLTTAAAPPDLVLASSHYAVAPVRRRRSRSKPRLTRWAPASAPWTSRTPPRRRSPGARRSRATS